MRYWPFSIIAESPLMPAQYAAEFYRVQVTHDDRLSPGAVMACGSVAVYTEPCEMPNLYVLTTLDGPPRRAYHGFPPFDEWARLERVGVVQDAQGDLFVLMDALH